MAAKSKVRLHYPAGVGGHTRDTVITEPLARFARENGVTLPRAQALLQQWVRQGHLRERADGGYDVVRVQPRQAGR